MGVSFIIAVQKDGEYLFAEKYRYSTQYFPALFRIARFVDEKLPDATLGIGNFASRGIVGTYTEWQKTEQWRTLDPEEVKVFADAARAVGLNYE